MVCIDEEYATVGIVVASIGLCVIIGREEKMIVELFSNDGIVVMLDSICNNTDGCGELDGSLLVDGCQESEFVGEISNDGVEVLEDRTLSVGSGEYVGVVVAFS